MHSGTADRAARAFAEMYGREAGGVAAAPGRVNIIGEHTDYNEGFALPAAVNLATFVAFAPRDDRRGRFHSAEYSQTVEFDLDETARDELPFWGRYPWGMAMSLAESGVEVTPVDGYVLSTVPSGGGLSSSASFEVALALAFLGGDEDRVSREDLVHICRRAENDFVGVNCGVMDQFASIFGADGEALLLDCRSLECRRVAFPEEALLVVADTGVSHALGQSGYHRRQEETRAAAGILSEAEGGVESLRDAHLEMIEEHRELLGDVLFRRARHVVTENARTVEAAGALERGDLERVGELLRESHESLRADYEVSCDELDMMVEAAGGLEGHFGTRMTGGGFGGCTVSLVEAGAAEEFAGRLAARYEEAAGREAATHVVRAGPGARCISVEPGAGD